MHEPAPEPFTKLSSNITDSSLWDLPDAVVKIWITLLAMADRYGYVGASIPGIAARSRKTIADVEQALALFMAPDPYSRSTEHEGRRVAKAVRGYLILNYVAYRGTEGEDRTRERKRDWMARRRARQAGGQCDPIGQTSEHANDTTPPGVDASGRDVDAVDFCGRLHSASVSVSDPPDLKSGSGSDAGARGPEVEPPSSRTRPVLRQGQPLVHWTLEGWSMSPELRAEAIAAGVPADEIDGYVEGLRAGPIGGSRGVLDRDGYVRAMFGRWRTWSETARHKRQQQTYAGRNTPNQPNFGVTGLEIFDLPPRRALA